MQHTRERILAIATLLLVSALPAFAADDVVRKSFSVANGGTLTIRSDVGSIEVKSAPANRVEVSVFRGGAYVEKLKLDFSQSGANVTVRGDAPSNTWSLFGPSVKGRVRYVVSVPAQYNVDLQTGGGSIDVGDLKGTVRAETSGGSLQFGSIEGPVWGRTSGGSIELTKASGPADLETSGGSISLGEVGGQIDASTSGGSISIRRAHGVVRAETSGGAIRVEEVMGPIDAHTSGGPIEARISAQPTADCRLSTSGGSVTVYLPASARLSLDAHTSAGSVQTDIPVTILGVKERGTLNGTINGGGPKLTLRSSGGTIRINKI